MTQRINRKLKQRINQMKALIILSLLPLMSSLTVADDQTTQQPPAVPNTPAAVDELIVARPFTLEQSYAFEWQKEQPPVTEGYLLVLKVNPELVYPRNELEPVLYVGNQTAERVNHGHPSGYVIAVLPGPIDLAASPIWFGNPELPERVDAAIRKTQREKAEQAGIKPFPEKMVKKALAKGGQPLHAKNRDELQTAAARMVVRYAPDEKFRVNMRLPKEER